MNQLPLFACLQAADHIVIGGYEIDETQFIAPGIAIGPDQVVFAAVVAVLMLDGDEAFVFRDQLVALRDGQVAAIDADGTVRMIHLGIKRHLSPMDVRSFGGITT